MGNRYRCAGSASETYINNERVYDRVDIKSPNQPNYSPWVCSFAELNGLMYISWFHQLDTNFWDLYTFDGENFTKYASFSSALSDICAFNNTMYVLADDKLYRLNGTSLVYITDQPSDENYIKTLFVLGSYLYLFTYNNSSIDNVGRIYRFTGSGWTQITNFSAMLTYPVEVASYNGSIHIMSYAERYNQGVLTQIKVHKIFNGSTLTDGAELPGNIQGKAAYVINNKLRVFRKLTSEESGLDVYELSGNTWSENTALNFEGWVNKKLFLYQMQAFYYKNEQYLLNVQQCLLIKVTNPIKMGQYFIS